MWISASLGKRYSYKRRLCQDPSQRSLIGGEAGPVPTPESQRRQRAHYWHAGANTVPATLTIDCISALIRGFRLRKLLSMELNGSHATDCVGIFRVMATQVRLGSTKPETFPGLRESDLFIRRLPAYSIRARGQAPIIGSECMGAISPCKSERQKILGKPGASM